MPLIGGWFQHQAVRSLAEDGSAPAVRLLGESVAHGPDKALKKAAFEALREVAAGGNVPAQETLCRLVIRNNHAPARKTAIAAGYLPHEELNRALFLFLTGQWKKYEELDVDHRLLRAAYENSDARIRARIAARARASGRLEWVDMVAGSKQARRVADMSDSEWTAALALLEQAERWDDIWRLAQDAPPRWSVLLLRRLRRASRISREHERQGCEELIRLARAWKPADLDPYMYHRTTLEGHTREVRSLAFNSSRTILASGSTDGTVRLWDMPDGRPRTVLTGHRGWVNHVAVTPDGEILASVARDGRLCLWRLPDGKRLRKSKRHQGPIFGLAISPLGNLLATSGADRTVRLWSLPRGDLLATLKRHRGPVSCLAISSDGACLATGSADCDVRIWSLPHGKPQCTLEAHRSDETDGILAVAFSPDGQTLASSGTDGTIFLWSVPGGRELRKLRIHTGSAGSLSFTPDGTMLISAGGEYAVQIWSVATGQPLKTLLGHVTEHSCFAMSSDGNFLATSGSSGPDRDHTIRLWSLREQQAIRMLSGHQYAITSLALSPDGRLLASGSGDSSIRLWSAEPARLADLPAARATVHDLESAQKLLGQESLTEAERNHLEFIAALLRWRMRLDIIAADAGPKVIELGEFDIEIEDSPASPG
jgi:WD40 repeat protein